jgi:gamma-glutamyltranspeptidase/glutathione hydrolase
LGFAISGRGYQSWLDAAHASSLQPGKRPRLTPNPALTLKEGKPVMPLGCPGGDAQVQAMLQVFLNIVEFGMAPQDAIEAPRVISHSFPNSFWPHHVRPGEVTAESRWETAVLDELRQRGHVVIDDGEWSSEVARVCTIVVDSATGVRTAGADPRSTAYAVAW